MAVTLIRHKLVHAIAQALERLYAEGYLTGERRDVQLTPPKQAQHGDFACNAAMMVAKPSGKNPREVAEKLKAALGNAGGLLASSEVAGPGFLNLRVADAAWRGLLADIVQAGEGFLRSDHGKGKRVLIEFVSANPTGPLHVAHGRGAVTGDVIANLLDAAGYAVEREYYVNDLGNQADVMARSMYLRYGELLGRPFTPPEDFYPGAYITDMARELVDLHGGKYLDQAEDVWLDVFRAHGVQQMLVRIKSDLAAFGIRFDRWVSERELAQRVGLDRFVQRLEKSGHVYVEDGKKWFKSTDFGDDKDRVVLREDGRPTYFATDIAYHDDKLTRGYDQLINIWGADHGGYITRVKAGIAALGHDANKLEVILVQMVSLTRGGEAVRMGKRLGTAVWLREIIDEAGKDATRYFFVLRRSDAQIDFDLDLATKKTLDNPVYYAQMGHARLSSIEAKAREAGMPEATLGPGALDALVLPEELELVKTLSRAPEVVASAADAREPHQIVFYIQELIAGFHSYYTQYKGTERVVSSDVAKTRARLLLCRALRTTLRGLLTVLGVDAPERMVLADAEGVEA